MSVVTDVLGVLCRNNKFSFYIQKKYESSLKIYENKIVFVDTEDQILQQSELLIVIGGDGTILHYAKLSSLFLVPILSVNNGRRGFLSEISKHKLHLLTKLQSDKEFFFEKEILLKCEINGFSGEYFAFNEFVVIRNSISKVVDYKVFRENNELFCLRADGIIISTPLGSSGYNFSCGGPSLHKMSNSIVVTPVASMDLNVRPMVLSNDDVVEISYKLRDDSEILVISDGVCVFSSDKKIGHISIRKSDKYVRFLRFYEKS